MENAVNMTRLNGVDNPAVTNDEGVNTRPDLVISIQPQSHAGNRAELPVTTVDWHSNPRGQFIPTNGLDFLIGVSRLLIQQTIELNDLTSKIDSENRYIIRVPHGEALYIASEVSSKTERCLCGTGRSFTMHLHDNTRQEALLLERRLAAASCCFPCRLQEMKVITPPGDYVGRVQQRWTWVVPFYLVRDGNDDVVFVVEGPAVMKRSALLLSEFKIMTGDSLREVGKISHGWDRDLNSFATTLQFPDAAVQPKHKALLLATTFLLSWITMVHQTCPTVGTLRKKTWPYHEYYTGVKDQEDRKSGQGSNHWTGPKSIEWFTGSLLRDTMHGAGEYRWRHTGDEGTSLTYEGHFYCNKMHGYGIMSYPDGRVFTGLFHSNVRWGPGKESHACLHEDVGLWCGRQLVRLAWRPATPSVAPDLYTYGVGKACVDPHRVMLTESYKKIGETNSALDLLKQFGSDPRVAAEKWKKLYPKNCTDLASPLCHVEAFEHNYYNGKVHFLQKVSVLSENKDFSQDDDESPHNLTTYYAWNNTRSSIHMMQHCFSHDNQRNPDELNLADIICGPRKLFRPAGQHEVDCRTLLMASYLGHTSNVVKLVNDCNILPDIADSLGNTAVMYATCGDQADIIHFLVEAGAKVDNFNDSCCTPLGIALVRCMCAQKEIAPSGMLQALLPPPLVPAPPLVEQKLFEWNFTHDQVVSLVAGGLTRTPSKLSKAVPATKRIKSSQSLKDLPNTRKKTDATSATKPGFLEHSSDELFSEDQKLYNETNSQFAEKINELFLRPSGADSVSYLFVINDMIKEIETSDEDPKKQPDKNPRKVLSKVLKETMKPSKELMWQSNDKEDLSSVNSLEKKKAEMIAQMMLTILQLLSDGANPGLVKCPQPALFIAIISGCPDLVKHLVNYGADINEVYNETFGYTPLDLAVSRQFTYENMELIRAILESGAITSRRLRYGVLSSTGSVVPEDGPTLLHAVLARKTESELEEEVRRNVLELLLKFNCSPLVRFKGHSAIEVAMTKSMDVFDIFIRSPTTSLNVPINDSNQSVLVKMFSFPFFKTIMPSERLQTLTNLLLFGSDPLLECVNGEDEYSNIFVFALKTLGELEASQSKSNAVPSPNKSESRKAPPAPKKEQLSTKSLGRLGMDDVGDYKQAIDLVTECARLLHVRWLQAKLVKELADIIDRYKHRQWNMIIKEHKHKKRAGLWLTPQRCLEIWDILKLTRGKVYSDGRVLKHLLHIVQYYNLLQRFRPTTQPTTEEKNSVEYTVYYLLKERVTGTKLTTDLSTYKKPYVKPELTSRAAEAKFKICFECALPLDHEGIQCLSCNLVAFCTFGCMKNNIERVSCHPCSGYLKDKYFLSPSESGTQNIISSI